MPGRQTRNIPALVINPNLHEYSIPGCNGTNLFVGADAEVHEGMQGALRTSPDLTAGNSNVFGYIDAGDFLSVADGPTCSKSEIMWKVLVMGPDIYGWIQACPPPSPGHDDW